MSLLQEEAVATALRVHKLSATDEVREKNARIALLQAFAAACERPVPSNALRSMRTAADMADFFEGALAPSDVQPHAKRLFERRVDQEAIAPLARVEATPEKVRDRFATDLPSNLKVDPATFRPRPMPVMQTQRRPAGLPHITTKMRSDMRRQKIRERSIRERNVQFTEQTN